MFIAITGTPGTGKTSVAEVLRENDFEVIDLNKTASEKDFIIGFDENRDSKIVDTEKLNNYILENFDKDSTVFIEGHLSHLLTCVDKIIVLRCNPDQLKKNLSNRGWNREKIKENIEAEILDIILCESTETHSESNVVEIDVTSKSVKDVSKLILDLVRDGFKNIKKYKIGKIDWSEEVLKDF